jgi:glycosyltransferase involved in cell wall biosynthesis
MDMSFLIPALNEQKNIEACIASINSYTPEELSKEIIVGDHGSTDQTAALATAAGAKVISIYTKSTIGNLRNQLLKASESRVIVFLDADVRLTATWGENISAAIDAMIHSPDQVTGSRCLCTGTNNAIQRNWFRSQRAKGANYINGGHMIALRVVFSSLNGFSNTLVTGEDYDLCQRAKQRAYKIVPRKELKVLHLDYPSTWLQFAKREVWHGAGDFQNIHTFLGSKVAILGSAYLLNTIFIVLILAQALIPPLPLVLLAFAIPAAFSFKRFNPPTIIGRTVNIGLCAVYLLSRGVSIFFRHSTQRFYDKEV